MTRLPDPITETDLAIYVDDQLSPERRIAVEAYLAERPLEAARIMGYLRQRDELRLAFAVPAGTGTPRTTEAARRLERSLRRRRFAAGLRRIAALGLLVTAGWLAHAEFGPLGVRQVEASGQPPAFVKDAVEAHRTSIIRAGMDSQPEATRYDPAEIRSATAIVMPQIPADWTVDDVQIFPSAFGPSVELAVNAGALGHVSLFAVRPGGFDVIAASLVDEEETTAAYWQVGDVAYALVTNGADRNALDSTAEELARTLY